jgi:hypothetical protein
MSFGETAWVDRHMTDAWARISEHVPTDWMPQTVSITPKRTSVREYGCGHYGCVMPTSVEGLVCKLTGDVSEAKFVSAYLSMGGKPAGVEGGIVDYEKILALRDQTHRGRPLFVLWRSEAFHIGFLAAAAASWGREHQLKQLREMGFDEYQLRPMRDAMRQLDDFKKHAAKARDSILKIFKRNQGDAGWRSATLKKVWGAFEHEARGQNPEYLRGIPRIAAHLHQCQTIAQEMSNTDVIYPVGVMMDHYLDEGLLLADVHLNNVGLDEHRNAVITDPGHVVAIHPRWASWPEVPVV